MSMFRHQYNESLTRHADYKLTKEDEDAYKKLWTASMRASRELSVFRKAAKLKEKQKA